MALFDKIVGIGTEPRVSVHALSAAFREWEAGLVTRQQIIDSFELSPADEVQLDQLKNLYAAKAANKKADFIDLFEGISLLAEGRYLGYDNFTQFVDRLQNF